jgi:hypothetical protein
MTTTNKPDDRGYLACQSVPTTREATILALVEHDVARWDETARPSATARYSQHSFGLALHGLYARAALHNDPMAASLLDAAKAVMTADDWEAVRS